MRRSTVEAKAHEAGLLTVPEQRRGPSAEMHELLEDTRNLAAKAASARAPLAATTTAERRGAIRHAEAAASEVAGHAAAAERVAAGIDNRRFIVFTAD